MHGFDVYVLLLYWSFRYFDWRRRYDVSHSVRLVGEAGEVNVNEAEEEMEVLRHGIRGYKPSNIFNMDETALFYKSMIITFQDFGFINCKNFGKYPFVKMRRI